MPEPQTSLRPQARPASVTRAAADIPEGQPAIVREEATTRYKFDHAAPMLIGIFGKQDAPQALIRLPSGAIETVSRGDRLGRRDRDRHRRGCRAAEPEWTDTAPFDAPEPLDARRARRHDAAHDKDRPHHRRLARARRRPGRGARAQITTSSPSPAPSARSRNSTTASRRRAARRRWRRWTSPTPTPWRSSAASSTTAGGRARMGGAGTLGTSAIHAAPLAPAPHIDAKDWTKSLSINVDRD